MINISAGLFIDNIFTLFLSVDVSVLLGRLLPAYFPKIFGPTQDQPLDVAASRNAFDKLTGEINDYFGGQPRDSESSTARMLLPEEVAMGFVAVANEAMCRPIRALTQAKGYDITKHVLSVFGGVRCHLPCTH